MCSEARPGNSLHPPAGGGGRDPAARSAVSPRLGWGGGPSPAMGSVTSTGWGVMVRRGIYAEPRPGNNRSPPPLPAHLAPGRFAVEVGGRWAVGVGVGVGVGW